jgi:hypothetical protein
MSDITAIINCYRRPWTFTEQFESIKKQTIAPKEILIWSNYHPDTHGKFDPSVFSQAKAAVCNANFGVWCRFAYALNAKTKYICIFDDDTIPGTKWFENCLENIKQYDGLLGARGLIYANQHSTGINDSAGDISPWCFTTETTKRVDIVGHAWFFEREWLQAYWRELPPLEYFSAGEDMHFSYTLQKYLSKNTYVPAQPKDNTELWGSLKAREYGCGPTATSSYCCDEIQKYFAYLVSKGFRTINYV